MSRSAASGLKTRLLDSGDQIDWTFNVDPAGLYQIQFDYSNDSGTERPFEKIDVRIDGKAVGSFTAFDSGMLGWGHDWSDPSSPATRWDRTTCPRARIP